MTTGAEVRRRLVGLIEGDHFDLSGFCDELASAIASEGAEVSRDELSAVLLYLAYGFDKKDPYCYRPDLSAMLFSIPVMNELFDEYVIEIWASAGFDILDGEDRLVSAAASMPNTHDLILTWKDLVNRRAAGEDVDGDGAISLSNLADQLEVPFLKLNGEDEESRIALISRKELQSFGLNVVPELALVAVSVKSNSLHPELLVGAVVIVHLGIEKYSSEGVYLISLDGDYSLALITECSDKSLSLIIDSQASEPRNVDPHEVVFLGKALAMNNAPNERVLH